MTPYDNLRLWRHFDRSRALHLLIDQTPLPTQRMPTDEELYASRELARIRGCESEGIDPVDACYGIHNPVFQPDAPLRISDFIPYPPLIPPQKHFYSETCATYTELSDTTEGHAELGLLMGRYLSGTLPKLTPSQFSAILHGSKCTPPERFLVYQFLSLISFPNLIWLRYYEGLSIFDIGCLALAADVRRYDLSRRLEYYCDIERTHWGLQLGQCVEKDEIERPGCRS